MDEATRREVEFVTHRFMIKQEVDGRTHQAHFDGLVSQYKEGRLGYSFCIHWPSGNQCFCWRAGTIEEVSRVAHRLVERIGVFKVKPRFMYDEVIA